MNEPQTSGGMLKLLETPKEVFIQSGKEKYKLWMHILSFAEKLSVEAITQENLRLAFQNKLDDVECRYQAARAEICQRLYYSLRKGPEEGKPGKGGASRAFSEQEIVSLPYDETIRLAKLYKDYFVPTDEERKNFLRERLGPDLGISSTSPSGTESKPSSRKERSNPRKR